MMMFVVVVDVVLQSSDTDDFNVDLTHSNDKSHHG